MLGNFTYLGILVIKKRSGKTFDTEFCQPSICTFFFFFFYCAVQCVESLFPDQGSNLSPLQWKQGVLPTGLSGNSPEYFLKKSVIWDLTNISFSIAKDNQSPRISPQNKIKQLHNQENLTQNCALAINIYISLLRFL